jgi:hypothetical protein
MPGAQLIGRILGCLFLIAFAKARGDEGTGALKETRNHNRGE